MSWSSNGDAVSRMPSYVKGKGFIAGMWLVLWLIEFGGIYVYVLLLRDGNYRSGILLGHLSGILLGHGSGIFVRRWGGQLFALLLILPVGTVVYWYRRRGLNADRKAFKLKYPDLDLHEDFTHDGDRY